MSKQFFLPESMCTVDSTMSYEKLFNIYRSKQSIVGKVIRLNSQSQFIEVDLGANFFAVIPLSDASIYPIYKETGELSPNVYSLVGKTIQTKIVSITSDQIILSRKANMLEALEYFKNATEIESASITSFSRMSAFVDIGAGILGRIFGKDFSNIFYRHISDVGIAKGEIISVKILGFLEEENKFELSRSAMLPDVHDVFQEGDVVVAKVFEPVHDDAKLGYFALVEKSFCGIVDSPDLELHYGDLITVFIKRIRDNGQMKFTLVEKI